MANTSKTERTYKVFLTLGLLGLIDIITAILFQASRGEENSDSFGVVGLTGFYVLSPILGASTAAGIMAFFRATFWIWLLIAAIEQRNLKKRQQKMQEKQTQ